MIVAFLKITNYIYRNNQIGDFHVVTQAACLFGANLVGKLFLTKMTTFPSCFQSCKNVSWAGRSGEVIFLPKQIKMHTINPVEKACELWSLEMGSDPRKSLSLLTRFLFFLRCLLI